MAWAGFWLGLGIFFAAREIACAWVDITVIRKQGIRDE